MTKTGGYWRTEYGLIEDRTHLGLGFCTGWVTTDLTRAEKEATVGRSQGHKVEIKQRQVFTTEWAPLSEAAETPAEHGTEERP